MVTIITVFILVMAASAAFIWFLCGRAPEGYEDQTGFHQTAEAAFAAKPAGSIEVATIKAHDDHEPIAA